MVTPYAYQKECLNVLAGVRREGHDRALIVMASGLGKTITSALDVRRWFRIHGKGRVLFLCHQNDILEQAQQEFTKVLGWQYSYAFFNGRDKTRAHEADFLFASFQTMREWRTIFTKKEFDYIVVDESHHTHAPTYLPTISYFQPKFLLGVTATPDRADLQDIRQVYGQEVYHLLLEEALANGLLTKVDYRLMTDEIQNLDVLNTPVGRMSIKELNKSLFIPKRDEEVVRIIKRHCRGVKNPRVMIFCRTTSHCDRLAKKIPGSLAIHYRLGISEQRLRLKTFREGGAHTILTVDKFNEGIDIPEANVIVFLRTTSSPVIFYQQLGRGLRKVRGKKKVLVLDFVSSCERLEAVHHVWKGVQDSRRKSHKYKKAAPLEVDVGKVRFTEIAKRVLKILEGIRSGYTREMLVTHLTKLAEKLGRTPMKRDVDKAAKIRETASFTAFTRVFGTFNNALEAAGFSINKKAGYTKEELIQQLKQLAEALGRTPGNRDADKASKAGRCASTGAFVTVFGSFNKALEAAGLPIRYRTGYNKEDLVQQLKRLAKNLGKTPRVEDVKKASDVRWCASPATFILHFGTFNKALEAAGLSVTHKVGRHTEESCIKALQRLARKLGRTPGIKDINEVSREECPDATTISRLFGGFNTALEAAGLTPTRKSGYTRKGLIKQLKDLAHELGRTPTCDDIVRGSREKKCASSLTFTRLFSSFSAALKAAGLQSAKRTYSKAEMKEQLHQLAKELRRTPTVEDVREASKTGKCVGMTTLVRHFGSFTKALHAARLGTTPQKQGVPS